jgi:glycopeptide antibiotics resistance protein
VDIDDLILNTIGTAVGYLIYTFGKFISKNAKLKQVNNQI